MTSFFPDLSVWLALSDAAHVHSAKSWIWMNALPVEARLVFNRYTQVGLLRLLTNPAVMSAEVLTLRHAWDVYDRWLADPRVEFHPEPRGLDAAFRQATAPFSGTPASKWMGDCYLLAFAHESRGILVTFDKALLSLARKRGCAAVNPD